MSNTNGSILFSEDGSWDESHYYIVDEVLFKGKTQFQDVTILKTRAYGKMLVLDGYIQSSEDDEYIYHESLVHPGLLAHPSPESVLVFGGGEGATLREVLRHSSIKRAVMVDIDREVVEKCIQLLPEWHQGSFDDPRVQVVVADGKEFVGKTEEQFDCIIIDICDALEKGPAVALYTKEFYESVKQRLKPSGLVIVQAMELNGLDCRTECKDHLSVRRKLSSVFRHVTSYAVFVPSFWCTWGNIIASDHIDVSRLTSAQIDERIASRRLDSKLSFYDGQTHIHMFALPKDVRDAFASSEEQE